MNNVSFCGAIHEFSPIKKEVVKELNELAKKGQEAVEHTRFDAPFDGVAEALKAKVVPHAGENVHTKPIEKAVETLNAGKAAEEYNQFSSF